MAKLGTVKYSLLLDYHPQLGIGPGGCTKNATAEELLKLHRGVEHAPTNTMGGVDHATYVRNGI
jgi:hypothetical protein